MCPLDFFCLFFFQPLTPSATVGGVLLTVKVRVIPSLRPLGASPRGKRPLQQHPEDHAQPPAEPIPRATVGPLPSTPVSKPRPGAPAAAPSPLPPLAKDSLPPPPPSPGQKSASGFWSSMPGSPASRPGSFTFPGEAGEAPVVRTQNQNQIQAGSGSGSQSHRHSTHSKEADRMSTCSSTSEQSIQSTQSNGVRRLGGGARC